MRYFDPANDRLGSKTAVRATLALSLLWPPKRKSEASFITSEKCHKPTSDLFNAKAAPCRKETLPEDRALLALGPEHLLAVNLVIGDCLLAFVRNEPVDELLAKLLLHMRMLGRVN